MRQASAWRFCCRMAVMLTKLNWKKVLPVAGAYLALLIILFTTNPQKLPVGLLFVPFILIFICLYLPVLLVIRLLRSSKTSGRKDLAVAGTVAGIPTVALLLSSINQLTIKDVALLSALLIGGLFYASRFGFSRQGH